MTKEVNKKMVGDFYCEKDGFKQWKKSIKHKIIKCRNILEIRNELSDTLSDVNKYLEGVDEYSKMEKNGK